MFDWGFWELVLIGVVALVVIGPERLPKAARVAGLWVGRARRTLSSVQAEINRELRAEELKSIMEKQAKSNPLESILEEVAKPVESLAPRHSTPGAQPAPGGTPPAQSVPAAFGATSNGSVSASTSASEVAGVPPDDSGQRARTHS